ncbi:hypothetical protein EX30DRAFT_358609 [Ascodesmis nigricans]|uniref:Uncharacterized protein n=1 Tax=Ascodesmis nigricans TaxID=341454 RepID=A0A4V3SIY6_9PEZI|nr:hypothetical protein EX30DRAFT_358609 [Ascodesmis nigricans]
MTVGAAAPLLLDDEAHIQTLILPVLRSRSFVSRDNGRSSRQNTALVIAVVFVAIVGASLIFYLVLRCIRRRTQDPPNFLPAAFKKRWRNWQPGQMTTTGHTPLPTVQIPTTAAQRASSRRNRAAGAVGVDRNSSIRSIMTLPEYRPLPAPDRERTIGRAGERAGIDVVIEFPETEEEEEGRREEHMETMYQIRRARARERELAREEADEARRTEATNSTASLMAALQSVTEREARLSQVSYADIGIQRPDGSRVRPSMDSDRPLLANAANMGMGGNANAHGRSLSNLSYAESIEAPERRRSDEIFNMGSARASMDHRNSNASSLHPSTAAGASIRQVHNDSGLPPAPDYEGADWGPPPEYTSPIETRTPIISRSNTPQPPGTPVNENSARTPSMPLGRSVSAMVNNTPAVTTVPQRAVSTAK